MVGSIICGVAERLERLTSDTDDLVAVAADGNASMIVVGSHGPRSSLLGSISAEVSRRAPCPVVVVLPGSEQGLIVSRAFPDDGNGHVGLDVGKAGGIVGFDIDFHRAQF
jgi:hypothetical protein